MTDCIVQHNGCFTPPVGVMRHMKLYRTYLLPLSHVQVCLAPASCPDPQSMEKNLVLALPSISDNPIYLADVLKLIPDPFSYMASELEVVTENLFLQTWVWFCWSLILPPVFPLSCTISVRSRMSRIQSTAVTAWSSYSSFTHFPMEAQIIRCLQGCKVPHSCLLSCKALHTLEAHNELVIILLKFFFLHLLLWFLYYSGNLLLKILVLQPHSVSFSPVPKPIAPC